MVQREEVEASVKIIFEKRRKLNASMKRKCKLMDNLMHSSSNAKAVKEETNQFNDHFKKLLSRHKVYVRLLSQEVVDEEDEWFETVDEALFTQKHITYN